MVLLSEGSLGRLGSNIEAALIQIRRVMKNNGRLFFVFSSEDEYATGGSFEDGMVTSIFDHVGFELTAARAGGEEEGVTVGYFAKKGLTRKNPNEAAEKNRRISTQELSDLLGADEEDEAEPVPKRTQGKGNGFR